MSKTITTYTLEELKEHAPDAFEKVLNRWSETCCNGHVPWQDEVMQSLKATIEACGGTMHNWSIGPWSRSSLCVSVNNEYEDTDDEGESVECTKDDHWLYEHVLKAHGYTIDSISKSVVFPGLCPFTGYCADDDFLESVYMSLKAGDTLSDALEGLASVAQRHMEDDCEQMQSEESMMANWGDNQYTIDGIEV